MVNSWRDDLRSETHPLFNDNKLKLGVFGLNGPQWMTLAKEATSGTWAESAAVSRLLDEAGFEANVPYARMRGFVEEDPGHRSGYALDTYTWAAATSQVTEKCAVFVTSHVPTIHPVTAAKQCATVDRISGGRFALNLVAGWNKPEFDMYGTVMRDHDDRYAAAEEWLTIVKRLWLNDEPVDFSGEYYNTKGAVCIPGPLRQPPPIMNAGGSERGRLFAAKHADIAFIIVKSDKPEDIAAEVDLYRKLARDEFGRDIQVWTYANVVQRDTEAEARRFVIYYAEECGDDVAVDGRLKLQGQHAKIMSPEELEKFRFRMKAGSGAVEMVGTPELIADRMVMLSQAGIDGVLLNWIGMEDGLRRWSADVMPMLVQAGLRS